jgi:hypothetical protein
VVLSNTRVMASPLNISLAGRTEERYRDRTQRTPSA